MKLIIERSNWRDTLVFGIGVSWEDRGIGEYRLWVDAGWLSLTVWLRLKEANNEAKEG